MNITKSLLSVLISLICAVQLWSNAPVVLEDILVRFSIPFSDQYSPSSVIIPFNKVGGLIILRAKVNDIEGNFILDTGANGLVLNNRYVTPDRLLANRKGMGLAGSTGELGEKRLDSLRVEELVFSHAKAQTIDLRQLENRKNIKILGLVGYEIIKNFEIMLDYRRRFLTFSKLDKAGNILTPLPHTLNKVDSISFTIGHHIPIIEVKVAKKKKRMGLDTGAEYNLLNIRRSKNIMSTFKILKTIEVTGTSQAQVDALAGKLYRVVVKERYKCAGMSTVLMNLKHLEGIYKTKLDGILGYEFLAPWLFSINYKKQKLYMHQLEYVRP